MLSLLEVALSNGLGWHKPPGLPSHGTIGIVAPAGPVDADLLRVGESALAEMGFRTVRSPHLFAREHYLAGPDAIRAMDMAQMFLDPEIDAIVVARGGFGCSRILPHLEELLPSVVPKILVGFSDVTALHLWLLRHGIITFHGPVAAGRYPWTPQTKDAFLRAVQDPGALGRVPHPRQAPPRISLHDGCARARIVGGNLSLLCASLGTPYEVVLDDHILFLEDVGEPMYRIDRMMTQLLQTGKLDRIRGMVLGEFLDCPEYAGRDAVAVIGTFARELDVPCFAGVAAGHGMHRITLPLGVEVEMRGEECELEILESAVNAAQ